MEFRVLQYFLTVAREETIVGAAKYLHVSQPTLSRQLMDLENDLGKKLFIRGNRKITLTQEGMILRKRAEEIMELVRKAENEVSLSNETIGGEISIGAGETDGMRLIAKAAQKLQSDYPNIHYHIISGDAASVIEQLDKGLIDFGLLLENVDITKYNTMKIPFRDIWGIIARRNDPLAKKKTIRPEDLWNEPLILSRQSLNENKELFTWFNKQPEELNIAATYSLLYNASLMVEEGIGYALGLDKIINVSGQSNLCFLPLEPKVEVELVFVWKKYQILTKACEKFLESLRELI